MPTKRKKYGVIFSLTLTYRFNEEAEDETQAREQATDRLVEKLGEIVDGLHNAFEVRVLLL